GPLRRLCLAFFCPLLRCPMDPPTLEITKAPAPIGCLFFIADRITQSATFPTHACPLVPDGAMHFMGLRFWLPVDRTALKMVETSAPIRRPQLISHRKA